MRLALLIAGYAVIAIGAAAFFSGMPVTHCLGGVTTDQRACYEAWLASRPWWERLLDTPALPIGAFIVASAVTIFLARRSGAHL
jgi:hypothetical protein